jgi:hypothetical protein
MNPIYAPQPQADPTILIIGMIVVILICSSMFGAYYMLMDEETTTPAATAAAVTTTAAPKGWGAWVADATDAAKSGYYKCGHDSIKQTRTCPTGETCEGTGKDKKIFGERTGYYIDPSCPAKLLDQEIKYNVPGNYVTFKGLRGDSGETEGTRILLDATAAQAALTTKCTKNGTLNTKGDCYPNALNAYQALCDKSTTDCKIFAMPNDITYANMLDATAEVKASAEGVTPVVKEKAAGAVGSMHPVYAFKTNDTAGFKPASSGATKFSNFYLKKRYAV